MTIFPKHTRVNIPGELLLDEECSVVVRVDHTHDVNSLRERYGHRLINFETKAELLKNDDFVQELIGSRVRVNIQNQDMFDANLLRDKFLASDIIFCVIPNSKLLRQVNYLTSFGFRVHVDAAAETLFENQLETVLDFYMHNPFLSVPIEPFHTLLRTICQKLRYKHNLWHIEMENAETDFYIEDNGAITLSKRWSTHGRNYGDITQPWAEIVNSDLHHELLSFQSELFRSKKPCIFCFHLGLCGGFLRALDEKWPCDIWQRVFQTMYNEALRAKQIQNKIG
jgi:hypothetical protein